ncbi:MAG: YqiJ family protein [Thalassotalea sp.]
MLDFFLADYNLYFASAISFVLFLSLIEGLGLVIGLSLMSFLEQFTPIDIDVDVDVTTGGLTAVMGWLCLNRLPLLIWLVVILSGFGLFGYSINYLSLASLGFILPTFFIVGLASIFAIYFTKAVSKPLSKILPKNETSAISNDSFVGLVGKITIGKATFQNPAEAVIHDHHGQKHYLLVAPESQEAIFAAGAEVVLIEKQEKYWLAMPFNSTHI